MLSAGGQNILQSSRRQSIDTFTPFGNTSDFQSMLPTQRCSLKRLSRQLQARLTSGASLSSCEGRTSSRQAAEALLTQSKEETRRNWSDSTSVLEYAGNGIHLGIDIAWKVLIRADGAFFEQTQSKYLNTSSGFDGGLGSKCWEVDGTSVPRSLGLDDHEHCLLSSWTRSGFWLRDEGEQHIDILLDFQQDNGTIDERSVQSSGVAQPSKSSHIGLKLKTGEIVGQLQMQQDSWLPEKFSMKVFGTLDVHTFMDWTCFQGHWFPHSYRHKVSAGSENFFQVQHCKIRKHWQALDFSMPTSWLTPPDTSFDEEAGGKLQAWWTASGHLVVPVKLDQKAAGHMILDTGASGFVIEKGFADRLQMVRFGSFHCSGMMDNVESCMRRCESISVGPLTIQSPLFMEMQLEGLVRGSPGPVIGIIGYNVFRRCVMDIPYSEPAKAVQGPIEIQLHNPTGYDPPAHLEPYWQPLEYVANLPLMQARIGANGLSHSVRLMIDLGAGGTDLMFNQRATDDLKLLQAIPSSTRLLKGVGGGSTEKQRVKSGVLSWMQMGESTFDKIECLFIGSTGLDLSHYVHGILCSQMAARCRTIFDFARERVAFIPAGKVPLAIEKE